MLSRDPMQAKGKPFPIPPRLNRAGIYLGTSGYSFEDWSGIFYPSKKPALSEKDRFLFYQKYFSFLEINVTFYKEPDINFFIDLEKRSLPELQFSVKVNQNLSHSKNPNRIEGRALMEKQIQAVSPLVESGRFYSFLIQLENHRERSHNFLEYLLAISAPATSKRMDIHIEFRHASWHRQEILQTLKDAGIGICNTEFPSMPNIFPLKAYATTPKGYLRYSGKANEYCYSEKEIVEHVESQGLLIDKTDTLAIAYNNPLQANAALNAIRNLEILRERLERRSKLTA